MERGFDECQGRIQKSHINELLRAGNPEAINLIVWKQKGSAVTSFAAATIGGVLQFHNASQRKTSLTKRQRDVLAMGGCPKRMMYMNLICAKRGTGRTVLRRLTGIARREGIRFIGLHAIVDGGVDKVYEKWGFERTVNPWAKESSRRTVAINDHFVGRKGTKRGSRSWRAGPYEKFYTMRL